MCKFKKWLAILGAAVLLFAAFEVLWADDPLPPSPTDPLDEHPWNGLIGGGSGVASSPANKTYSFYLVQFGPYGQFYVVKISLPALNSKGAADAKKLENKNKLAQ